VCVTCQGIGCHGEMVSQCLPLRARAASVMEAAFAFHLSGVTMSQFMVCVMKDEPVDCINIANVFEFEAIRQDSKDAIRIIRTDGHECTITLCKATDPNKFFAKLIMAVVSGESFAWVFPHKEKEDEPEGGVDEITTVDALTVGLYA